MNPGTLRALQVQDLREVTHIHLAAFPNSALGQLGYEALRRYYHWQLNGPHDAIAYGVYQGDVLAGFCFAGIFRGALSGFLRKNRNFLIWLVLTHPWLIATPVFRERLNLARNVLVRRPVPVDANLPPGPKSFGILSIAVDPKLQRSGYGRQLMLLCEKISRDRGFTRMNLTVAVDNHQAIQFYQKLGWQKLLPSPTEAWHGSMTKYLDGMYE